MSVSPLQYIISAEYTADLWYARGEYRWYARGGNRLLLFAQSIFNQLMSGFTE